MYYNPFGCRLNRRLRYSGDVICLAVLLWNDRPPLRAAGRPRGAHRWDQPRWRRRTWHNEAQLWNSICVALRFTACLSGLYLLRFTGCSCLLDPASVCLRWRLAVKLDHWPAWATLYLWADQEKGSTGIDDAGLSVCFNILPLTVPTPLHPPPRSYPVCELWIGGWMEVEWYRWGGAPLPSTHSRSAASTIAFAYFYTPSFLLPLSQRKTARSVNTPAEAGGVRREKRKLGRRRVRFAWGRRQTYTHSD